MSRLSAYFMSDLYPKITELSLFDYYKSTRIPTNGGSAVHNWIGESAYFNASSAVGESAISQ